MKAVPAAQEVPADGKIVADQAFGDWIVVRFLGKRRSVSVGIRRGKPCKQHATTDMWECRCVCGTTQAVQRGNLLRGRSLRCKICRGKRSADARRKDHPASQNQAAKAAWDGIQGSVSGWSWDAFCEWFNAERKARNARQVKIGRREEKKPHSPANTHMLTPQDTHAATIAALRGISVADALIWVKSVSRQRVAQALSAEYPERRKASDAARNAKRRAAAKAV